MFIALFPGLNPEYGDSTLSRISGEIVSLLRVHNPFISVTSITGSVFSFFRRRSTIDACQSTLYFRRPLLSQDP